ncbi:MULTISPECIES: hypothetical protein [unclassified Streptomyces]|uniref:hypothetical protein n=1 Tax=unclassified Streptomyces TaxID=2593676 RepID=UPI00344C5B3D
MSKKTLRSVLAVAFSVGLASGVFSAQGDPVWDTAPNQAVELRSQAAPPPDLAWDFTPTTKDRA